MTNVDLINMKNLIVCAFDEVIFNDAYLAEERINHCVAIIQECFDQLLEGREKLKNEE